MSLLFSVAELEQHLREHNANIAFYEECMGKARRDIAVEESKNSPDQGLIKEAQQIVDRNKWAIEVEQRNQTTTLARLEAAKKRENKSS